MRPKGPILMPMVHPAYTLRTPITAYSALSDWRKAMRLHREGPSVVPPPITPVHLNLKLPEVLKFLNVTTRATPGPWAADFEATLDGKPVCMSIWDCESPTERMGFGVTFLDQGGTQNWAAEDYDHIHEAVVDFLTDPKRRKVGHNIVGYDFGYPPWNTQGLVKRAWDVDVQGIDMDTMVAHYMAFVELRHSLSYCASIVTDLGPYKTDVHELGKDPNAILEASEEEPSTARWARILDIPREQLLYYCMLDSFATAVLYQRLLEELR